MFPSFFSADWDEGWPPVAIIIQCPSTKSPRSTSEGSSHSDSVESLSPARPSYILLGTSLVPLPLHSQSPVAAHPWRISLGRLSAVATPFTTLEPWMGHRVMKRSKDPFVCSWSRPYCPFALASAQPKSPSQAPHQCSQSGHWAHPRVFQDHTPTSLHLQVEDSHSKMPKHEGLDGLIVTTLILLSIIRLEVSVTTWPGLRSAFSQKSEAHTLPRESASLTQLGKATGSFIAMTKTPQSEECV